MTLRRSKPKHRIDLVVDHVGLRLVLFRPPDADGAARGREIANSASFEFTGAGSVGKWEIDDPEELLRAVAEVVEGGL